MSVSVSDTGIGMDEEMKKKCFTLFGNLKFKQDINQGGMGLGLAAASLICKSLNGELNLIRSDEGEGSKFQFTISIEKILDESETSKRCSQEIFNMENIGSQQEFEEIKESRVESTSQVR